MSPAGGAWLLAAAGGATPSIVWVWPFAALLLAIAILPLVPAAHHWWEQNRNKLLVAGALALVTLAYYALRGTGFGHGEHVSGPGLPAAVLVLKHAIFDEYVPFLTLLASLYIIAGGIVVRGDIQARPLANTAILGIGSVLASLIGTTGASMVLIRLLIRTNRERTHTVHTFVFFIYLVSNCGGLLLPIGDPPLFLGYLRGVPFWWTLSLWQEWLFVVGSLLLFYYLLDVRMYAREPVASRRADVTHIEPVRMAGLINWVWLAGVVAAVALIVPGKPLPGTGMVAPPFLREIVQLLLAGLSLLTTPRVLRMANQFNYGAILEVAALFLGIFITMQVPLELLHALGPNLAGSIWLEPVALFWATGGLSSFLDNAPTYVVFFETVRQITPPPDVPLVTLLSGEVLRADQLIAISCGAVFLGAMTYIGNGPNFMVKAIVERAGIRMPTFFGYLGYAIAFLVPVFAAYSILFLRG